ncbi:MAG: hypothetical protein GXP32_02875 [Kiritimatiellaeota bacterium]|nr:hypothetical protein [Kiritimatiellota bacterium]
MLERIESVYRALKVSDCEKDDFSYDPDKLDFLSLKFEKLLIVIKPELREFMFFLDQLKEE